MLFNRLLNMAKEKEEKFFSNDLPTESPEDMFATDTSDSISESDVFAGTKDFYKTLSQTGDTHKQTKSSKEKRHYSTSQKVLAISIITLLITLSYALIPRTKKNTSQTIIATPNPTPSADFNTNKATPSPTPSAGFNTNKAAHSQTTTSLSASNQPQGISAQPSEIPSEPVSLRYAEKLYLQRSYTKAFDLYKTIFDRFSMPDISISKNDELLRDFCRLKMAFCKKAAADYESAYNLLRKALQSSSPVIKAFANYKLCFIDIHNKQFKKARARAYQALAIADVIDFDPKWIQDFKSDCHFLIAESMTIDILSMSNSDKNMPEDIWRSFNCADDPFINLQNQDLIKFLSSGSEQLDKSLFMPRIEKSKLNDSEDSFTIVCRDCSAEEVMSRLASSEKLNISWVPLNSKSSTVINPAIRNRPVTIYTLAMPSQQIAKMVAGCAGLLAQIDNTNTINICDLQNHKSLDEHISLLNREAISLWKSFLLTYYNDSRIPNAHFALGKLLVIQNNLPNAIAEFKLTATRFSNTDFAPIALLHSSLLKSQIHDYAGAGQDLNQLIEQYPDSPVTDQACLYLAETNFQMQHYAQASKKYQKVYYLSPNRDYQIKAALGTAKSFYEQKDYINAEQWFNNYFKIVKNKNGRELYLAYFTFGQTSLAMNKTQQACNAFKLALHNNNSKDQYLTTLLALTDSYIKKKDFVNAIKLIEQINPEQFSPIQYTKILLIKSKVLRSIGLTEKAQFLLGDNAEYISDPQFKSKIMLEISRCYISQGNLTEAEKTLLKIITIVEPGYYADQIKLELAQVLFDQNKPDQTILICTKIMNSNTDKQISEKASKLASEAYKRKDDYNNAAVVLMKNLNYTPDVQ